MLLITRKLKILGSGWSWHMIVPPGAVFHRVIKKVIRTSIEITMLIWDVKRSNVKCWLAMINTCVFKEQGILHSEQKRTKTILGSYSFIT